MSHGEDEGNCDSNDQCISLPQRFLNLGKKQCALKFANKSNLIV